MGNRKKVFRRAKYFFSESEYRRFFRAVKTLESKGLDLSQIYIRQQFLFDVFPDFSLLYTSLFVFLDDQKDPSLTRRFLNADGRTLHSGIENLLSLLHPKDGLPQDKEILHLLFASFKGCPRLLYFFLAEEYLTSFHIQTALPDQKISYAKRLFRIASPLAKRLGIRMVQEEFDALAFSLVFQDDFNILTQQRLSYIQEDKYFVRKVSDKIRYFLKKEGLSFQISGRIKGLYSIYKKLSKKGCSHISSLNDVFAFRILVSSVGDCYRAFGVLQQHFRHRPGKIKDYISCPKPNGYKSLHTILYIAVGEKVYPFEVQIRTEEMHDIAQSGMAAHLFYKKEGVESSSLKEIKKKVKQLSSQFSSEEFLRDAQDDLFARYIFVYTPQNKIIPLGKGSTVLDFAYAVHSDLGDRAVDALVNGEKKGIDAVLQNGDHVLVSRSDEIQVKDAWQDIAFLPETKKRIRSGGEKI